MPTRQQIEERLEKEPEDVFLHYTLAMLLRKEGREQEALERFDTALALDPGYIPAYFQKGMLLAAMGRTGAARDALETGIEAAQAAGDEHARGEMAEFLDGL